MRLVVSSCAREEFSLLLYDPDTGEIEPIPLPDPGVGAFGISYHGDVLCVVVDRGRPEPHEPEVSELVALDPQTFAVEWRYTFRLGRDVHSLASDGRYLYAVSTGTDELLRLRVDRAGVHDEEVAWRPARAHARKSTT